MAPRFFHTTARTLKQWLGLHRKQLPQPFRDAVEKFTESGGGAEARLGDIKSVTIKHRDGVAVHRSHFNPNDPREVVSARIEGTLGTKTCHVFADGTGTTKKGEEPR